MSKIVRDTLNDAKEAGLKITAMLASIAVASLFVVYLYPRVSAVFFYKEVADGWMPKACGFSDMFSLLFMCRMAVSVVCRKVDDGRVNANTKTVLHNGVLVKR